MKERDCLAVPLVFDSPLFDEKKPRAAMRKDILMLLEFSAENFKSFRKKFVFSMQAASKQRFFSDTLLVEKLGSRKYKAVSTAVIYGPNASGKTNIVSAIDTLRSVLLRGNIVNPIIACQSLNMASEKLELVPNIMSEPGEPTCFDISFFSEGFLIRYVLSLDLGAFLQTTYKRAVIKEKLSVNNALLYDRDRQQVNWPKIANFPRTIRNHISDSYESSSIREAVRTNLQETDLLLPNARMVLGAFFPTLVTKWFEHNLRTVYSGLPQDTAPLTYQTIDRVKDSLLAPSSANLAASEVGKSGQAIGYIVDDGRVSQEIYSLVQLRPDTGGICIPAEQFESFGTVRFFHAFSAVRDALLTGSTLVMDEFDASLHPSAVVALVSLFHNRDVNKRNAQLIFNTHNLVYLNRNLFRRDELKFVDRNDDSGSEHWSLADFGTSGPEGVRSCDNYLRDYMKGEYGAIRRIDLTDLFETSIGDSAQPPLQTSVEE